MSDLARDAMTPHLAMWTRVDVAAPPDDVAPWLARAAAAGASVEDHHRRYIDRYDGPQHADPARTARYRTALDDLRARADRGEALTLDALAHTQGLVLGLDGAAPLRVTDAFARGGAHRYPFTEDLAATLDARLACWRAPHLDAVVAACGLYLDVIFTHPFDDGNTRAANLCYERMFRAARRPTPRFEDLLVLRKDPGDARGFWRMVRLSAASIVGQTRRAHP
ncbi:MAG: Fic family protein [Polyangiales bacterium]